MDVSFRMNSANLVYFWKSTGIIKNIKSKEKSLKASNTSNKEETF